MNTQTLNKCHGRFFLFILLLSCFIQKQSHRFYDANNVKNIQLHLWHTWNDKRCILTVFFLNNGDKFIIAYVNPTMTSKFSCIFNFLKMCFLFLFFSVNSANSVLFHRPIFLKWKYWFQYENSSLSRFWKKNFWRGNFMGFVFLYKNRFNFWNELIN